VGRATARAFAARGANLGLIARGLEGLEAASREARELGGDALPLCGDVSDAAALEDATARVEARFGAIDVWVNNAMVSVFSPVKEMRMDECERVTDVTYPGVVRGTFALFLGLLPLYPTTARW
jgi:NAD(P)-dependent dehydrogenase (short-subunit alcohol dehydrogenase family)